jgi:hypothetical protein
VLADGERAAGNIEHPPLRLSALTAADRFSIERFTDGMRRLFTRYLWLGAWLAGVYLVSVGAYAAVVLGPPEVGGLEGAVVIGLASLALILWITLVNFAYLLVQIVMATDDCALHEAVTPALRLVVSEARPILGVLAAILGLMVLTTAASVLATAALGLIAFVPFVGLAALPLQIIAWLVRGVVFQYISLAGASAYLRLYRVHSARASDL